jgi:16S rRNA processing protein RimM
VRGAVRIKSYTAEPADVARYGSLADEAGQREFKPRLIGLAKGVVLVKFTGIVDRDAAEALRGCRLYLPREALPPPDEEEYYHADLIGLDAVLGDGTRLGWVHAVHDFGAGDCLEIVRPAGPPAMVPFTRAVVPVVDLESGRLVIDPLPGLLESALRDEEHGGEEATAEPAGSAS